MNSPEPTIYLRTIDHPEANGRQPKAGEKGYTLIFPLEDGTVLRVGMGSGSFGLFADFIACSMVDDAEREVMESHRPPPDPASDEDLED